MSVNNEFKICNKLALETFYDDGNAFYMLARPRGYTPCVLVGLTRNVTNSIKYLSIYFTSKYLHMSVMNVTLIILWIETF